jgi:hypothetical protein
MARDYFEHIVKATATYKQNAGWGTVGRNHYESANQMANYGNEIREYIQQLASAGAANATDNVSNMQMEEKLTGGWDEEAHWHHCRHGLEDDQQWEPGSQR